MLLCVENVADTDSFEFILTEQLPVPEQAPPQPVKVEPLPADAVRDTDVPSAKAAEQLLVEQSTPLGVLVTLPLPLTETLRVYVLGADAKLAEIDLLPVIDIVHPPVPEQDPPQPAKLYPDEAVAVSETLVPSVKDAEHELAQSIPPGLLVTRPLPLTLTLNVYVFGWVRVNVADTDLVEVIEMEQVPVPPQAPVQPEKFEPLCALAESETVVPLVKLAEHVPGQLMPAGLLMTLPLPPSTVRTSMVRV